ncbi:MAG: hypothetical protein IKP95_07790 [Ruminococcus sp.]|nr:hypothetical protein [Ruminococcus sp.]
MKSYITLLAAVLLLCSCAEGGSSAAESSIPDEDEFPEMITTAPPVSELPRETFIVTEPRKKHPGLLTADVISYEKGILTYEYEGERFTAALDRSAFFDYQSYSAMEETLSEKIINNRFGIPVKADLRLNEDKTAVTGCNVFDKNVEEISAFTLYELAGNKGTATGSELACTLKRIEGSLYELSNKYYSVTVDLNELGNTGKADFGDLCEDLGFKAYRFLNAEGDKVIPAVIGDRIPEEDSFGYIGRNNLDLYRFFGTVQAVGEGRASVLLTDGKTLCNVPAYYNDGEIKEGAEVMVVLKADASLFGSGEQYSTDYAVFYTRPKDYLLKKYWDIQKLAYALNKPGTSLPKYDVTTIEELEAAEKD